MVYYAPRFEMVGWITPEEAKKRSPGFFDRGTGEVWDFNLYKREVRSKYGFAQVRVAIDKDGNPLFDRVMYGDMPGIAAVIYGREADGTYKVGVVIQKRPFVDMPYGEPADSPILFAQPCVLGALESSETPIQGAVREVREEAGVNSVLSIRELGFHNCNPSSYATWDRLLAIEIDPTTLEELSDSQEVDSFVFVSVPDLLRRIAKGEHEGVSYRAANANNAFLVWLASHPEIVKNLYKKES